MQQETGRDDGDRSVRDRLETHPGYWPSPWPVECGGNRRQKARTGVLGARDGAAQVVTRIDDRWHVMAVRRDPGEWYLGGTMPAFAGPAPFGWVERVDPDTLQPVVRSPELPCGEHVWCGSIAVHANGSILSVNGSFLHRLDPETLEIVAERRLPVERAHNGMLVLADGTIVTKDLRLEGQGGTTISRFEPEALQPVGEPLVLPEGSMGRIAAEVGVDGVERIYVPGTEHLWRLVVASGRLVIDDGWRPRYRDPGRSDAGLAWDSCLSDDACWLMDCGDIAPVRHIHTTVPNGRFEAPPDLSWRQDAPWAAPQRLLRVGITDGSLQEIAPFGTPGGGIIAPPVAVPEWNRCIAWDSVNGGLAGVELGPDGDLGAAWHLDVRPSMQPVVFPDSGELVINDYTDARSDDLVVVDIGTGELIDRVPTGSRIANGMFLTAGDDRDVWYCSTTTVARVTWA